MLPPRVQVVAFIAITPCYDLSQAHGYTTFPTPAHIQSSAMSSGSIGEHLQVQSDHETSSLQYPS